MNYRHAYHAGNSADVFKHAALLALLAALKQKPAPLFALDTHAGSGRYDLTADEPQKTLEHEGGIGRLRASPTPLPPLLADYVAAAGALGPASYPGSPLFVRQALRPGDRLVACEKHPEEAAKLKAVFRHDRQVAVHETDGYHGLRAFLPPPENRGLVLIDPPFESKDEFATLSQALADATRRWSNGVYMVWYPLKERAPIAAFYDHRVASGTRKQLVAEVWQRRPSADTGLNGSGLLLINPPYRFDDTLRELTAALHPRLSHAEAPAPSVRWLVPE
jgi:23S rRNA (adenine2030-N6)-methyltransferase